MGKELPRLLPTAPSVQLRRYSLPAHRPKLTWLFPTMLQGFSEQKLVNSQGSQIYEMDKLPMCK
eukprot:3122047-Pleurochrysis_carterae.AAC.2